MTGLRLATYRELNKVAALAGFRWVRTQGSHNVFRNEAGRTIVIPDHGHQPIVRPLLRKILRDMGLSVDRYHELLDKV